MTESSSGGLLLERVAALDVAVGQLSSRVQELAHALNTVNELDAQQQEINRQIPIALASAEKALDEKRKLAAQIDKARDEVRDLADNIIPREEVERQHERDKERRNFMWKWFVTPMALVIIGLLAALGYVETSNRGTLQRIRRDELANAQRSYQACAVRNQQAARSAASAGVARKLLADIVSALPPGPGDAKVQQDVTMLFSNAGRNTNNSTIDCTQFLKRGKG